MTKKTAHDHLDAAVRGLIGTIRFLGATDPLDDKTVMSKVEATELAARIIDEIGENEEGLKLNMTFEDVQEMLNEFREEEVEKKQPLARMKGPRKQRK